MTSRLDRFVKIKYELSLTPDSSHWKSAINYRLHIANHAFCCKKKTSISPLVGRTVGWGLCFFLIVGGARPSSQQVRKTCPQGYIRCSCTSQPLPSLRKRSPSAQQLQQSYMKQHKRELKIAFPNQSWCDCWATSHLLSNKCFPH